MREIEVNKTRQLVIPNGVTNVQIVHEWGDIVLAASGLNAGENFSFTPDSIGAHSIHWKNGLTTVTTEFVNVYLPVITAVEFFELNPDFELDEDKFKNYERRVRSIIENYTGQKFGPYTNKTIKLQGMDGEGLELPVRIRNIYSVSDAYASDFTDYVEVAPGSQYWLQRRHAYRYYDDIKADISVEGRNFFSHRLDFHVTGDFGWPYVPADVTEAAYILMEDEFSNAGDLRKHGINEAQLGDFSYKLNADQWGTTGNTQVDLMLAPYVMINLGLV